MPRLLDEVETGAKGKQGIMRSWQFDMGLSSWYAVVCGGRNAMAKKKLTVSVDERLYALAHARKQRTGRPISNIVEQALWRWVRMPIAEAIGIASIPLPVSSEAELEDMEGISATAMDGPEP